jgi:capsular polysaccharide export protein
MNFIGNLNNENILFLQGPMGTFFKRLDKVFRQKGANTYKIAFNAADWFFSNKDNVVPYKGTPKNWEHFIYDFLLNHKINKLFLFGDCRFYQKITIKIATKMGIEVFVFEEGYVRPNYITLEKQGVNNNSKLPRAKSFYENLPDVLEQPRERGVRNSMFKMIASAISYYAIAKTFKFAYPHYIHHRDLSLTKEAFYGARNFVRKIIYTFKDAAQNDILANELSKKYFFVPLQTSSDFQIKKHSLFKGMEEFIEVVLNSFALSADKEHFIVFKHHPIDRGKKNYTDLIKSLAAKLGVAERVMVVFELHIPNTLKNAIGTVTINSTVGLSSLYHGTPTITLGKAIYDIHGLTCKGVALDDFWQDATPPDANLFKKFRAFLIKNSQINSSFYGDMNELRNF